MGQAVALDTFASPFWTTITFSRSFDTRPIVAVLPTTNGSLQVTLERAESVAGTVGSQERIGNIAIQNNTDLTFVDALGITAQQQGVLTPVNIQGFTNGCFTDGYPSAFANTPLAVASANTRAGNNGG
jgi:hypothetical protein